MSTKTNKEDASYWTSLKVGNLVQLKDEQTIEYLMDEGVKNIVHGADFTIDRDRRITSLDNSTKWLVFDISLQKFSWFLVVKIVGSSIDVKVFYSPDDFEDGSREDILKSSYDCLFEEKEGCEVKDLIFSQSITEGEDVEYEALSQIYGICIEADGDSKDFATVVEYHCDSEDNENPDLFVLELNTITGYSEDDEYEDDWGDTVVEVNEGVDVDEESSYIMFLQGCVVPLSDVDILR